MHVSVVACRGESALCLLNHMVRGVDAGRRNGAPSQLDEVATKPAPEIEHGPRQRTRKRDDLVELTRRTFRREQLMGWIGRTFTKEGARPDGFDQYELATR